MPYMDQIKFYLAWTLSGADKILSTLYGQNIISISGPDMEFIYLARLAQTYLAQSGPDMV